MEAQDFLAFYTQIEAARDHKDRNFSQILKFTDSELEHYHDFIQLLFPLPEKSDYNSHAPIVNEYIFLAFRSDPCLQDHMRLALSRMLQFYGFDMTMKNSKIEVSPFKHKKKRKRKEKKRKTGTKSPNHMD